LGWQGGVFHEADDELALIYNNPPRAFTSGMVKNQPLPTGKRLPASQSFFSIEGHNVVLSSLKKAESGEALILRLYNPTDISTQATIRLPFIPEEINLVGLDELPKTATPIETTPVIEVGGKFRFDLPPKKIITLRVERL